VTLIKLYHVQILPTQLISQQVPRDAFQLPTVTPSNGAVPSKNDINSVGNTASGANTTTTTTTTTTMVVTNGTEKQQAEPADDDEHLPCKIYTFSGKKISVSFRHEHFLNDFNGRYWRVDNEFNAILLCFKFEEIFKFENGLLVEGGLTESLAHSPDGTIVVLVTHYAEFLEAAKLDTTLVHRTMDAAKKCLQQWKSPTEASFLQVSELDMLMRLAKIFMSNFFLSGAYKRERFLFYVLDHVQDKEALAKDIFCIPKMKYPLFD
jgi:hypothetical protein